MAILDHLLHLHLRRSVALVQVFAVRHLRFAICIGQPPRRGQDLRDDLTCGQIPRQSGLPVAQKTQPIAQPAWVLMQTVRRSLPEPLTSS